MKKWLWSFVGDTIFAMKYIIVNTDKGDGRDILFQIYGRDNMSMSYLLDYEPNKEEELRDKYGYKKIADWNITNEGITIILNYNDDRALALRTKEKYLTCEDKQQIWDKMIGGI